MTKAQYIKARAAMLKMQRDALLKRLERQLYRDAFIKKHKKQILALDMTGWPRLKEMKHRRKWLELVYKAKIEGVYGMGNANCDVIMQLSRFAKEQ